MMENHLAVAIEAAREAGQLLLRELDRPVEVEYKGDVDIVTVADRRSEAAIVEMIRGHYPRHAIVAEEGGGREAESDYCWYVDPLDGTTNFAHGFPVFCVSIGLAVKGEVCVGVVYDPVRGELFTAEKGAGAFLNQRRIRVSNVKRLSESLFATGFPSRKRHENANIHYYHRFTLVSHGVRRAGSAALDLCYVACGRLDGFWEFNLHPWDTAAGMLMVREAGGLATDFSGAPYRLGDKEIAASNGRIHVQMRELFAEIAATAASGHAAEKR